MSEDLRTEELEAALNMIRRSITQTASSCGRDPNAITLVAASKTVDSTRLQQAIDSGQRVLGENRVQEAREKWPAIRERNPHIELHLIGPLQSSKARDAVVLFDVIQSIDSEKLARVIARECERTEVSPSLLIQVNTSREPQKGGVMAEDDRRIELLHTNVRKHVTISSNVAKTVKHDGTISHAE
jgi:pyridoxal phosphate enzyme (YggS family)